MTQNPFDPLAVWRDMLSKWEAGVNDLANRNMASPEFSQVMNQAMGMSVRMQHALGEMMQKYLTAMNMPSRADLIAVSERLQGIEDQLARLTSAMERGSGASVSEARPYVGPPRTKRPASAPSLNGPVPSAAEPQATVQVAAAPSAKPARRASKKKSKAS